MEVAMSQVIRISESLYKRLESHAKGFDTPSSVLERVLNFYEAKHSNLPQSFEQKDERLGLKSSVYASSFISRPDSYMPKTYNAIAKGRFSRDLENDIYTITSPEGNSKTFKLPEVNDKRAIKELTCNVEEFVQEQGGTIGQIKAARKKLTEYGYHITK